jgi:CubicO group peptidase (beta-lactamase class C family)
MIKTIIQLIVVSCAFKACLASGERDSNRLNQQIDQLFNRVISKDAAGCATGIFEGGEISYQGYFGMANTALKKKINATTQFRLASNSKQFTASIIALLAEKMLLSLDTPLSKYFPKFPSYANSITLLDLIQHTSGLRDYFVLSELAGIHPSESFSKDYALRILSKQKSTDFLPDSAFSYSNSGYILLEEIVERVTHKSFREVANELIFKPLSMSHSFFDDKSSPRSRNIAMGYLPDNNPYESTMDMGGAGGMVSTISDLAKWDNYFYQDLLSKHNPIIETLVTPGKLNTGVKHHYAFGLEILHHGPFEMQYHGGEMEGALTEFIRIPKKRLSIALLCNRSDIDSFALAMKLLNLKLPIAPKLALKHQLKELAYQSKFKDNAIDTQQYSGHYWDQSNFEPSQIIANNQELNLINSNGRSQKLLATALHQFKITNVPYKAMVYFSQLSSPMWNLKIDFDEGQLIRNLTQYKPADYSKNQLTSFIGDFYSEELDISYTVSLEDEQLQLSFAKLNNLNLSALMDNKFSYTAFYDTNTISFMHDSEKNVIGFVLDSPRAKGIYFQLTSRSAMPLAKPKKHI